MDEQTRIERRQIKLIVTSLIALAIIAAGAVLAFRVVSTSALLPFENILKNEKAVVSLCNKVTLDLEAVRSAFKHLSNTKMSGSNPVDFFTLKIASDDRQTKINIGQDSRDFNLFWVYSEESLIKEFQLGFIRSKHIASKVGGCV